jgi:eukaryotic-like serine/threonine-protein kinase
MALSVGARLGPYEIVGALGAGGMGEVYKARDTRLDRTVAIKVLSSQLAEDPQFQERFEREARAISQLNHPNICALHDIGKAEGFGPHGSPLDFLVLEYLEGKTLATRLEHGRLDLAEALRIAREIVRRSGGRTSPWDRPSRPEARQHHVDEERRKAARLRPGQERGD